MIQTKSVQRTDERLSLLQEAQQWANQVSEAARIVFGVSDTTDKIRLKVAEYVDSCERLIERNQSGPIPIVLLGRTGEGKTWLAQRFLKNSHQRVLANYQVQDRDHLVWFGPEEPPGLKGQERYHCVSEEHMIDLGVPYLIGDAPGFSSCVESAQLLHRLAVSTATVYLIVMSDASVRDGDTARLFRELAGARAIPVIRFRGKPNAVDPSPEMKETIQMELERWRNNAPNTEISDPILIPDADLYSPDNVDRAIQLIQRRLQVVLTPILAQRGRLRQNLEMEIRLRRKAVAMQLAQYTQELTYRTQPVLEKLREEVECLPHQWAKQLLGSEAQQDLQVRLQVRALWLKATPAWAFPYRGILGLLVLTSNAWDRLALSLLGSWSSAMVTVYQSIRNVKKWREAARRWHDKFVRRFESEARSALQPHVDELYMAVRAVRKLPSDSTASSAAQPDQLKIRLVGLGEFQQRCRDELRESTFKYVRTYQVWLGAAVATLTFAIFLAGPILAVYREYLQADVAALTGKPFTLREFPYPDFGHLLACFALSAIPVAAIALLALGWATRQKLIRTIREDWCSQVEKLADNWRQHRLVGLEYDDPLLRAVDFLTQLTRNT